MPYLLQNYCMYPLSTITCLVTYDITSFSILFQLPAEPVTDQNAYLVLASVTVSKGRFTNYRTRRDELRIL